MEKRLSIFNLLCAYWSWLWSSDQLTYCTYPPTTPVPRITIADITKALPAPTGQVKVYNNMLRRGLAREPGAYNMPVEEIRPHRQAPPHKNEYSYNNPQPKQPDTPPWRNANDEEEKALERITRIMFGDYVCHDERFVR